ncbi:MAG: type II toxin-antitoxin system RelE/ParE family toxin, partial [Proteobacteria bacterium]|nr:type II toxin-antitoxin system RelE/ParE family toxin [Pseudomonadota bacterium]
MLTTRIFQTIAFRRFAEKQKITNKSLINAIGQAELGNVDANLGGGVIKQRVARDGGGKSSGYRVIIAIRKKDKSFLLHGFAKSYKGNIKKFELGSVEIWLLIKGLPHFLVNFCS